MYTAQTTVPVPQGQQPRPEINRLSLLDDIVSSITLVPKEFKAQEGKCGSLGYYGNGKVTVAGIRFQVAVTVTVVNSKNLTDPNERVALRRQLGL